VKHLNT